MHHISWPDAGALAVITTITVRRTTHMLAGILHFLCAGHGRCERCIMLLREDVEEVVLLLHHWSIHDTFSPSSLTYAGYSPPRHWHPALGGVCALSPLRLFSMSVGALNGSRNLVLQQSRAVMQFISGVSKARKTENQCNVGNYNVNT